MNQPAADIESAQFVQGIARAWRRRERIKRWSYRLGWICGRVQNYARHIGAIFRIGKL